MRLLALTILLLLLDISCMHLTHYPLVNSILAYYIYLLVSSQQYTLLILPGCAYALESLLIHDMYSYNLLLLLGITYLIISTTYCLYRTRLLALLLTLLCTGAQGLGSSIFWHLPYSAGLIYTSWLISVNIGIEILIWYLFDRGKQGNRSRVTL